MTVNNRIPISCKNVRLTGQQFIDLLPAIEPLTDGLIFIGSISHMIYWRHNVEVSSIFSDLTDEDIENIYKYASSQKKRIRKFWKNEGVKQNSYRLAPLTTAVLFNPRTDLLPATDPFSGQTKLLLSENPVNNCKMLTSL